MLQYTIGLLFIAITLEIIGRAKDDETLLVMSKTVSKVSAVIFAVGAVTGTMSEFGLIIFWPNLLEKVGRYFFSTMYLEIFAFMAEVIFVYMYYYTWDRISPKWHMTFGAAASLGAIVSALMIVTVNTLMNYPPGLQPFDFANYSGGWSQPVFVLVDPANPSSTLTWTAEQLRASMQPGASPSFDDVMLATVQKKGIFGIMFGTPGAIENWLHAANAGIATTSFTILGVYAWRYLSPRDDRDRFYYRKGIGIMSWIGGFSLLFQLIFGHGLGQVVAEYNPEKFAAMEGTSNQIWSITRLLHLDFIPKLLGYGTLDVTLPDYDAIPHEFAPPLLIHYIYYLKIGLASLLGLNVLFIVIWMYYRKKELPKWVIKANIVSPFFIQTVSTFGWMTRELGRKPWTVYNIMYVEDAASITPVPTWVQVLAIVYTLVLGIGLLVLVFHIFKRKDPLPESIPEYAERKEKIEKKNEQPSAINEKEEIE